MYSYEIQEVLTSLNHKIKSDAWYSIVSGSPQIAGGKETKWDCKGLHTHIWTFDGFSWDILIEF